MLKMYYCRKCHNIVCAEEDYSGKLCFQCESANFVDAQMTDDAFAELSQPEKAKVLSAWWGYDARTHLLTLQANPDKHIYYNREYGFICEDGEEPKMPTRDILNWKALLNNRFALGKCGELYAQVLLEELGFEVYRPFVDDHGVDLLAKRDGRILKVQVKTARRGSYTFVCENNFQKDDDSVIFYIRISDEGVPCVYVYPSIVWPNPDDAEVVSSYDGRFSYHPYAKEGQISAAEYGISGADKHYRTGDEFCIDTDDFWQVDKEKFNKIIAM